MPADTPVTIPVDASTVATEGEPLVHVPPAVVFARVVVVPTHADVIPVMTVNTGGAFTVSDCCAVTVPPQPPVMVYKMLQVPAATAVTTPEEALTVAKVVLLLLQAPVPPLNTVVLAV